MGKSGSGILKWKFDISTFRLIGRELITDRITALFELVKNCYDANSTNVEIEFYNVKTINRDSKIFIKDNGCGMTFIDVRDKWMVIGTANKRNELFSPAPFNRRYVGEKGIGRFAVDKLGEKLNIITKKADSIDSINVEIDWSKYVEINSEKKSLTLFTEIENDFKYEISEIKSQGTILEISQIREIWTLNDVDRLYKELTKLVSPFYPLNPPFNIKISSNEFPSYNEKLVSTEDIKYASHEASINFLPEEKLQEILIFDREKGKINTNTIPIKSFGGVKIKFFYFNDAAKRVYNRNYKNSDDRIDGVKIYRNGLIATPFAEFEAHPDKKRDILGIDKRMWRDIFNRINTREIIGVVDISKEENPKIIDATNRQDFVENKEYSELKEFIIEQLNVFSELKIFEREKKKENAEENLKQANEEVMSFVSTIEEIEQKNPTLKLTLEPLKEKAKRATNAVKKGITEQKKAEKEFTRKENIYLSLMSLQDYAANIAHAVRTTLSNIKDKAEFYKENFPNPELDEFFILYATEIYEEMTILNKVIDFMLSYAGSNVSFEELEIKELIENIFNKYEVKFRNENIKSIVEIKDNFIINSNRQFFADIFQNLILNSIKALDGQSNKLIKCSSYIENDKLVLYFSDNGSGIKEEIKNKIFNLYFTTTAEQGGAGIGLFIVKTRIEALNGAIDVISSEFNPVGATFKITFPFKK
ncbi:MAG TPA: sensor histidine kinase [Bacteroidales bacterium]|nr:sensor histidine kinase [Bacteroidales bacterium]